MASRHHGITHYPITGNVLTPSGLVVTSRAHRAFKLLSCIRAQKPCCAGVLSGRRKIPRPRRLPTTAKTNHCLVNKSNAHRVGMVQAGLPERPRKSPKDRLQASRHSCVCLESFGAHLEPRGMNNSPFLKQRCTTYKSSRKNILCN